MEVNLTRELEAQLDRLAAETGRAKDELVKDVVTAYVQELGEVRSMLDNRYDVKNGRVKPIDGEEAFARLHQKGESHRTRRSLNSH